MPSMVLATAKEETVTPPLAELLSQKGKAEVRTLNFQQA